MGYVDYCFRSAFLVGIEVGGVRFGCRGSVVICVIVVCLCLKVVFKLKTYWNPFFQMFSNLYQVLRVSVLDLGCEIEEKHQVEATEHGHGLVPGHVCKAYVSLRMKEDLHWDATA